MPFEPLRSLATEFLIKNVSSSTSHKKITSLRLSLREFKNLSPSLTLSLCLSIFSISLVLSSSSPPSLSLSLSLSFLYPSLSPSIALSKHLTTHAKYYKDVSLKKIKYFLKDHVVVRPLLYNF